MTIYVLYKEYLTCDGYSLENVCYASTQEQAQEIQEYLENERKDLCVYVDELAKSCSQGRALELQYKKRLGGITDDEVKEMEHLFKIYEQEMLDKIEQRTGSRNFKSTFYEVKIQELCTLNVAVTQ